MTIPEYRAETASALTRVLYDGRFDEVHSHWRELFTAQAVAAEEQSHDTRVQRAYAQLRAANRSLTDPRGLANDPHRLAAMHEWAATVDQSLATVAGIHYNLFLGSLLDADPHPARELAPFLTMERTGTFLVTELGHGNSAARLETTATYHAEDGTFTLHTPVPAARKFMPNTSLLGGAKSAVVAARLLVAGEDRGVFGFLVPLHDGQALLPGVHIRRLPAKAGSPVDHCLTWFDGVTLPRHALLEGEHGRLDADGILNGRMVAEGEKIGVVSNYLDHPNGTSRHLHFDVQVFTRDGWLWVNPYTTLVSAYERLIRGRGREIGPEPGPPAAVAHAQPDDVTRNIDTQEGGGN